MQKLSLKLKDKWWAIFLSFFLGWVLTKFLDYFLVPLVGKTEFFAIKISALLGYRVPLYILFSYLLAFILGVLVYKFVQWYKISKRDFKIIKATYGKNEFTIDITKELNDAVLNNSLNIVLSNNIVGDPCSGVRKIGKIKYQHNGEVLERDYIEGEFIILPRSSLSEVQIQAITALLSSFGAEPNVISGAEKALRGKN